MILSLVSQKGGVSKSTLAVSIAWELHARGARVLAVDGDPQGSLRTTGEVARELGRDAPSIVAMGRDMYRPEQLPRLAAAFDHVVIDTPAKLGEVQRAALMVSDVALIPVGQTALDAWGNADTLSLLREAQTVRPHLRAALVLTRKLPRTGLGRSARQVLEQSDLPVFAAETTLRVAWQEAIAAGQGVAQYAPKDKATVELRALLEELFDFVAGPSKEIAHA